MKWVALLLISLSVGCCSSVPEPITTEQLYPEKPPEDLTGALLNDTSIPDRFKRSYVQWVRYGWDRYNQIKDRPGLLNR